MSINLVTYANQTVTPTNDAIIYERAIDQNGIFHGCNVTVSSNNVNITGGYGIICGREFVIESESISVTLAPSGTNDGRLYVRLDLADADAPIQLLTDQGNPLPPLEQDTDVNYVNGAYEMELATFTVGVSSLSGCTETFETITGTKEAQNVMFKSVSFSTTSTSIGALQGVWKTATVTVPNGYTPLCFRTYGVNNGMINMSGQYINVSGQTATVGIFCQNITNGAITCQCDGAIIVAKSVLF